MNFYRTVIRPILFSGFRVDPESSHHQVMQLLHRVSLRKDNPSTRWLLSQAEQSFCFQDTRLAQQLWQVSFPNPVGLAAGFDKDAIAANIWESFGFGYAELGTVTYHPQPGNPKPRLFRLPMDSAVLNRMGFNNEGSAALRDRLQSQTHRIPWGINLGKSKITPLEEAANDYLASFKLLKDLGDYFVVNVSSPNTPGLRSLQDSDQLSRILDALQGANDTQKPLLVKIAPDLEEEAIASVIELAKTYQLSGLIATNTTIRRDILKT
ncbi:MAG: quinone-dependent dihydroorotate dehydrogenase, partial [Cyanobacteriota bacterium]